jgi:hypothetical protein
MGKKSVTSSAIMSFLIKYSGLYKNFTIFAGCSRYASARNRDVDEKQSTTSLSVLPTASAKLQKIIEF